MVINKPSKAVFFLITAFLIVVVLMRAGFKDAKPRPNIIFILADDMGYGDVSALNPTSKIKTPHLDALVKEGMSFTEGYTGSALCTPARYAFLTGRYPFRTKKSGVLGGYSPPLIEYSRETVASCLKKAGYATAIIGKWHLGLEWQPKDGTRPVSTKDGFMPENLNVDYTKPVKGVKELGFDFHFISPAGNNLAPFCFVKNGFVTEQPTTYVESQVKGHTLETRRNGGDKAPGFAYDETLRTITQESLQYLEEVSPAKQPFFLYLALTAPHFPWSPAKEFVGTSQAGLYGDYVQEIDFRVGQLISKLKELQILDNTLVIFTADNGGAYEASFLKYKHEMNYGRRGQKNQIWQGGVRVPFIARWDSQIKPGSVSNEPICFTDMLMTFASLSAQGIAAPYGEDSYDVSAIFFGKGKAVPARGPIVTQAGGYQELSIIKDHWKLVPYGHGDKGIDAPAAGEPKGMLFNMMDDPKETTNLYAREPEHVKELSDLLEKYKQEGHSRKMQ